MSNLQQRVSQQQDLRADRVIQEVIVVINLPEVREIKAITVIEQITRHAIKSPKPVQSVKKAKLCSQLWFLVNLTPL
jgi:hypothetical protein